MLKRRIGIEQARPKLGDLVGDAYTEGIVTILTSHRIDVAAIVPLRMIAEPPPETVDAPLEHSD
jgi:hypothetical protein